MGNLRNSAQQFLSYGKAFSALDQIEPLADFSTRENTHPVITTMIDCMIARTWAPTVGQVNHMKELILRSTQRAN